MKVDAETQKRLLELSPTFCKAALREEPRGPAFCPLAPCADCDLGLKVQHIKTFEEFVSVFGDVNSADDLATQAAMEFFSKGEAPVINMPRSAFKRVKR